LQTLLGFDFGLQRIGVAIGQEVTGTATALRTVKSRNGQPDWEQISELIQTWQPDALVVGLPLHADGSESNFTQAVTRFARQLEGRFHLPVHTMDERLSSQAASGLQGTPGNEVATKGIDAVAARIILQDWLGACRT
jgi:putative Holliday junction resolvase